MFHPSSAVSSPIVSPDYSFVADGDTVVILYSKHHHPCGPEYAGTHGILFDMPSPAYTDYFGADTTVALFRESLDKFFPGKYQYLGDFKPHVATPFTSAEWRDIPRTVSHKNTDSCT